MNTAHIVRHGRPQSAGGGRSLRVHVADVWSTEAARLPEPRAFVCWTVARLREKDDGGKQLILQVLRQLEDDLDQVDPAVLGEQKTAGAKKKKEYSQFQELQSSASISSVPQEGLLELTIII